MVRPNAVRLVVVVSLATGLQFIQIDGASVHFPCILKLYMYTMLVNTSLIRHVTVYKQLIN